MEVKPGYKLTEVGVFPEDWAVEPLGRRATLRTGPFGSALHKSDYTSDGVPVVNPMHIVDGKIQPTRTMTITEAAARKLSDFRMKAGEVVIGRRGDMGRCAVVQQEHAGWLCGTGSMIIRPLGVDSPFLQRVLSSPRAIAAIEEASVGTTMINLNQSTLAGLIIQFPPLPEQRAIASALSDVDALLGGLDQIIFKKRDLKQAAMQQLLNGRTRLPGFSGAWKVKTLGIVFEITAGKSKSAYITDGGDFVICDMGSVSIDGRLITSKRTNYRGDFLLKGDLVMPKDDIGGGKIIGRVGYVDGPDEYVLGDHVYRLHAVEGDSLFFSYLINSHSINSTLRKKVIGSAQLGLGRRSVEDQEIPFPSPDEQTAIAAVLSDIDAELTALESRREKTLALKQAMMQELLTGRTRLI
jgi:type I restriction enzyme S subunit